jgi:hypothetical protein
LNQCSLKAAFFYLKFFKAAADIVYVQCKQGIHMELRPQDAKQWQAHLQLSNAIASVKQESGIFRQALERILQEKGNDSVTTSITTLPPNTQHEEGSRLADLLLRMIKLGNGNT